MIICIMKEVFDKFGFEVMIKDFIGYVMVFYQIDLYFDKFGVVFEVIECICLYGNLVVCYGKFFYIYFFYGFGEFFQGFVCLLVIYGGIYMFNINVDEVVYEGDKVVGIKVIMINIEFEMKFEIKVKIIIGDLSYFFNKVKVVGYVLRVICILKYLLVNMSDVDLVQLIIFQSQVGCKNDIYIVVVLLVYNVCFKGYWIVIVLIIVEMLVNYYLELVLGIERLGKIEEQFMVCFVFCCCFVRMKILIDVIGFFYFFL